MGIIEYLLNLVALSMSLLIMGVMSRVEVNGTLLRCESRTLMLDEAPELRHLVINCNRKIRLTITLHNSNMPPKDVEFLMVNFVYDPELKMMMRLFNPIVVMMKRDPLILAYPFFYATSVNGKASEEVINKDNRRNYTRCDDMNPVHATCGVKIEEGRAIPYSEGFCCSCKDISESIHPRGGQDCSNEEYITTEEEQEMYLTSAHCLRFNPTWYFASRLSRPVIKHNVYLQVFVRQEKSDSSYYWLDITNNRSFTIGPDNPFQFDDDKSIVMTYLTEDPHDSVITINYDEKYLMMPQQSEYTNHHEFANKGATDYLLLPKNLVQPGGTLCDTAGVSFEAFVKQLNRCKMPVNTCLKNQPLDLWKEDDEKRKLGQRGSYLLEFFGTPSKDPVLFNKTTNERWLALEHQSHHISVVYIEIDASSIVALGMGKHAQLTSVITSSTDTETKVNVFLTNTGLVSSRFNVKAVRCDERITDSIEKTFLVSPQNTVNYELDIRYHPNAHYEEFTCILEARSAEMGVVAIREITMKVNHRCICLFYCKCNCLPETINITCIPLDEYSFHLSGFRGAVPVLIQKSEYFIWNGSIILICLLSLILLGMIKVFLGLCYHKSFEEFGLRTVIFRRTHLDKYWEPEFRHISVQYNDQGYPVYPGSNEKARVMPYWLLCCLNLAFFLIIPLLLINKLIKICQRKQYYPLATEEPACCSVKQETRGNPGRKARVEDNRTASPGPTPSYESTIINESNPEREFVLAVPKIKEGEVSKVNVRETDLNPRMKKDAALPYSERSKEMSKTSSGSDEKSQGICSTSSEENSESSSENAESEGSSVNMFLVKIFKK